MEHIHVALASNSSYFAGLATTLVSLLRSNRENGFIIHVIDGGLSRIQRRYLSKRVAAATQPSTIRFIQLEAKGVTSFAPDYGNSHMTYARLFIASLVADERVIYLDTDLLVAADVRPLWELPLRDCLVAAVQDPLIEFLRNDYPHEGQCGDEKYFNAGVMVLNLQRWRECAVQERLLGMIAASPQRFRWWDQTAMNALFRGQVHFLGSEWNMFADSLDVTDASLGKIYHYVGPAKPWNKYLDSTEFRLWRLFYRRHVRSQYNLYANSRLGLSFASFIRHTALRRSRALRMAASSYLAVGEWLGRKEMADRLARLRQRCEPPNVGEVPSRRELEEYVARRWG